MSDIALPEPARLPAPHLPAVEAHCDRLLDAALAATFPASDPVAANRFD